MLITLHSAKHHFLLKETQPKIPLRENGIKCQRNLNVLSEDTESVEDGDAFIFFFHFCTPHST